MENQDWSQLGEEVKNIVQSAVETRDFKELNHAIGQTLNTALDQVGKTVDQVGKNVQDSLNGGKDQSREENWERSRQERSQRYSSYSRRADERMYEQARRAGQSSWRSQGAWRRQGGGSAWSSRGRSAAGEEDAAALQVRSQRYSNTGGLTGAGVLMTVSGVLLAGTLGLGLLTMAAVLFWAYGSLSIGMGIGVGILGLLTAGGVALAGKGISTLSSAKRFRRYVERLGNREFCQIQELAEAAGKTSKFVRKDLHRMIGRRMFRQGHLDKQGTCLMVTDKAYEQYQTAQKDLEQRQQEEKRLREERTAKMENNALSEEAQKVIQEGNQYLEQIKKSNDAIPGEEVSRKISRLELVIGKIFDRVEEHPELISDLRRFMDYYLPTTVKLLNAYEEMDAQPVQGPNIQTSKKEIEDTLDTISQAFENLLDSFFEDTAWDISSDISVLQTMLAQEGLTKSDFPGKENGSEHWGNADGNGQKEGEKSSYER